jgi:TRAP-type uncharacterized transport system fused permease subunit
VSEETTPPQPPDSAAGAAAASTVAAEQATEKILREVDSSSRFRTNLGWWAWVIGGISVVFTAYHLYAAFQRPFNTWMHSSLHLAGATVLIFFLYPASKRLLDSPTTGHRVADFLLGRGGRIPWYDVLLGLAGLFCNLYVFFDYSRLVSNSVQILGYSTLDFIVAVLGVLLILEATRRCVGLPIVVIAGVALLYGLFGNHSPVFRHSGLSVEDLATNMFLSNGSGIFGTPVQVSANFIFLFLPVSVLRSDARAHEHRAVLQ